MPEKISENLSPRPGLNSETIQRQEPLLTPSEELLKHGTPPDITVDYGVTTDALGTEESQFIWHAEIGKTPDLE